MIKLNKSVTTLSSRESSIGASEVSYTEYCYYNFVPSVKGFEERPLHTQPVAPYDLPDSTEPNSGPSRSTSVEQLNQKSKKKTWFKFRKRSKSFSDTK